jgi:DNA-binding transcriptional MocR family regulator
VEAVASVLTLTVLVELINATNLNELLSFIEQKINHEIFNSLGLEVVRNDIAEFIRKRDNAPANPEDIFLTTGASNGIKVFFSFLLSILVCISNSQLSCLIPILNSTHLN